MRITRDIIVSLHYKLKMFGVPLNEPNDVMWYNQRVAKNTRIPKSTWGKKHNSVNYDVTR